MKKWPYSLYGIPCHPVWSCVILCRLLLIESCLFPFHPVSSSTLKKWYFPVSSYTHREWLFLCHPVPSYVGFDSLRNDFLLSSYVNHKSKTDQIWLQSQKSCQSHVTMISECISSKQNFDDRSHIWSLFERIAIMYGPLWIYDCNNI